MPSRGDLAVIAGSERDPLPGSRRIGLINPNERIEVTLYVRQVGPEPPIEQQGEQYPQHRHYLSAGEFQQAYGADPADLQTVAAFAAARRLAVVETNATRRSVLLTGPVAAMNQAFGTELVEYAHPSGPYRGRTGPVHVPAPLAGIVEAVFGLDNRRMIRRAESPQSRRPAKELARLYNFPKLQQGRGQTIGILIFTEFEGGYSAAREVLGAEPPEIVDIVVRGLGNRNVSDEVMLEIRIAAAMAPDARLAMYFSEPTEQGWVDGLTTAVADSTNNPCVLTIGYGSAQYDWTESAIAQMNRAFRAAAARGITVCCASGAVESSVDYPASSPYVLSCGGTKAAHGAQEAALWAALIARINEGLGVRLGYFNPLLRKHLSGVPRTEFGSPDGAALLRALRSATPPSHPTQ